MGCPWRPCLDGKLEVRPHILLVQLQDDILVPVFITEVEGSGNLTEYRLGGPGRLGALCLWQLDMAQ